MRAAFGSWQYGVLVAMMWLVMAAPVGADPGLSAPASAPVPLMTTSVSVSGSLEGMWNPPGPESDYVRGRSELVSAVTSGDPERMARGLEMMASAAEAGSASAARFIGVMYLYGEMVPQNSAQAEAWLNRAAEMGDRGARRTLGILYEEGESLPANPARAVRLYESLLADPWADYNTHRLYEVATRLGHMVADGRGVNRDPKRARALWQEAAARTAYPLALIALAKAQANGIGGPRDRRGALDTYVQANAALGDALDRFPMRAPAVHHQQRKVLAAMEALAPRSELTALVRAQLADAGIVTSIRKVTRVSERN